jgi:hypothetical protein
VQSTRTNSVLEKKQKIVKQKLRIQISRGVAVVEWKGQQSPGAEKQTF